MAEVPFCDECGMRHLRGEHIPPSKLGFAAKRKYDDEEEEERSKRGKRGAKRGKGQGWRGRGRGRGAWRGRGRGRGYGRGSWFDEEPASSFDPFQDQEEARRALRMAKAYLGEEDPEVDDRSELLREERRAQMLEDEIKLHRLRDDNARREAELAQR